MSSSLPNALLHLLISNDLSAFSSSIPDTGSIARMIDSLGIRSKSVARKDLLASLSSYLCVSRKYASLQSVWGDRCRRKFERECASWPSVLPLFGSMLHIVQEESGSAVLLSPTLILTAAHCICHPDDPEEEEEGGGGLPAAVDRIGRHKILMSPSGGFILAKCIKACDVQDLALLQVIAESPGVLHQAAFPAPTDAPPIPPYPAICVGNPSEFDLESDRADATIHFKPPIFHTSSGKVTGETNAKRRAALHLGSIRHTCWTYWGHSGAPLLNKWGQICGLHNTWDAARGTRHAVGAKDIASFVKGHLDVGPSPDPLAAASSTSAAAVGPLPAPLAAVSSTSAAASSALSVSESLISGAKRPRK